jgi:hypothetical protein
MVKGIADAESLLFCFCRRGRLCCNMSSIEEALRRERRRRLAVRAGDRLQLMTLRQFWRSKRYRPGVPPSALMLGSVCPSISKAFVAGNIQSELVINVLGSNTWALVGSALAPWVL